MFSQNSIRRGLLQLHSWPLVGILGELLEKSKSVGERNEIFRAPWWAFPGINASTPHVWFRTHTGKWSLGVNIRLESMVRFGTAIHSRFACRFRPSSFHPSFLPQVSARPQLDPSIQDGRLRLLACTSNLFLILN